MKKRHIYIATLFIALLSFSACNDEWKDELYVHMVSLKAPINDGEVQVSTSATSLMVRLSTTFRC